MEDRFREVVLCKENSISVMCFDIFDLPSMADGSLLL